MQYNLISLFIQSTAMYNINNFPTEIKERYYQNAVNIAEIFEFIRINILHGKII